LLQAKENYVRQGAFIALSFVLIQQTAPTCENVVEFRKNIMKIINEKGEDTITKVKVLILWPLKYNDFYSLAPSLHRAFWMQVAEM
jgi:hypothetical protein